MSLAWDPSSVQAQCKLASHELRLLKHEKDTQNFVIRRDIAALLQQQNVWLAREKAQNLLVEDSAADLLERLEMHVELLLECLDELNSKLPLSPMVLEAVASIIYAAPRLDLPDLQSIQSLLVNCLGSDSATGHVSPMIIQSLAPPPPSASDINACLADIALDFDVNWTPEPTRHEIVDSLARMASESPQGIELSDLRRLCRHGIPDNPSWLRPRIWKLLLCLESTKISTWTAELRKQRDNYYDLVRLFLGSFLPTEPPGVPLSPLDASLLDISKQLSRIPTNLFVSLQNSPDTSLLCPLDPDAPKNIKISSASNLILRLAALKNQLPLTSEIRRNGKDSPNPPFGALQTTFMAADLLNLPKVDSKHASALLRILYIHAMINPGILSPHVPSLLIPLYTALNQEDRQEDAPHVEADTFWLFEAMMAEFSELEDENISNMWLRKFGERVAWADKNLYDILCAQQLDPALPHYSYRWLATLLTHSLPPSSIFPVWDVLFSRPTRSRGTNPKLDHLLDVCAAMLLCARPTLLRLCRGRPEHKRIEAYDSLPEDSDAFIEAMTLLQNYHLEGAGGIERILQTASDLLQRRQDELGAGMVKWGSRIKETIFGGFTDQLAHSAESDSSFDVKDGEGSETDTFADRIAMTVWKGITNQIAMDPPPSPPTPRAQSPPQSLPDEPVTNTSQWSSTAYSTLLGYAERMKDSDTVAAFSKVSSNWKAKALIKTWRGTENPRGVNGDFSGVLEKKDTNRQHDASSSYSRPCSPYSPPPRPAFFRPPRDSYIPSDTEKLLLSSQITSPSQTACDSGIMSRTKASLTAMTRSPPLRSAPRALILSSTSPITSTSLPRLPNSAPAPDSLTWNNIRIKKDTHRTSLSSISSVSDSMNQPLNWNTSDSDINGSSRRVPLNRKSVSPLAPQYRTQYLKQPLKTGILSDVGQEPVNDVQSSLNAGHSSDTSMTRSPPGLNSPPFTPLLHTPSNELSFDGDIQVTESEKQRGSILLEHPPDQLLVSESHSKRPLRKKTPPNQVVLPNTAELTTVKMLTRPVRVRAKRYLTHSTDLPLLHEQSAQEASDNSSSLENLQVEWPSEDQELIVTPRASSFDPGRDLHKTASVERKGSNEGRTRKVSGNQRVRKVSSEGRGNTKNARDSAAEEGDDEGYDDLLSAYESEEGTQFLGMKDSDYRL